MTLDEAIKHCEEKAKELSDKAYAEWGKSMTEEEAYNCNECAREHEQLAEWLKELKALKEAPKRDLISREALKKEISNNKKVAGRFIEGVIMLIDNAPSVEVDEMTQDLINKVNVNIGLAKPIKDERPQGEWIGINRDCRGYCDTFKCSICGAYIYPYTVVKELDYNGCPYCFADMRGAE